MRISDWSSDVCSSDLPDQMGMFLARRLAQGIAHRRISAEQALALIERLSADLARMIDAHQARRFAGFLSTQGAFRYIVIRVRPEERSVGKEGDSKCRYRRSTYD